MVVWQSDETHLYVIPKELVDERSLSLLTQPTTNLHWSDDDESTHTAKNFEVMLFLSQRLGEHFHTLRWLSEDRAVQITLPPYVTTDSRLDAARDQSEHDDILDELVQEFYEERFPMEEPRWVECLKWRDTGKLFPLHLPGNTLLICCRVVVW